MDIYSRPTFTAALAENCEQQKLLSSSGTPTGFSPSITRSRTSKLYTLNTRQQKEAKYNSIIYSANIKCHETTSKYTHISKMELAFSASSITGNDAIVSTTMQYKAEVATHEQLAAQSACAGTGSGKTLAPSALTHAQIENKAKKSEHVTGISLFSRR